MEKSAGPVVAYLTAGGAGMFCGSCMRDNALVAALAELDCEPLLIPLYTPVRTDEANVAVDRVFFGGVNVYLQQKSGLFRWIPRFLDGWLSSPWLLNRVASRSVSVDAKLLGDLTLSMVRGEDGRQRKEIARLVDWLQKEVQPDLVVLSNVLIAGSVPALKRELGVPVLATLQGDDIFWESLPESHREACLQEIRKLCRQIDGFITFSNYYADFMAKELAAPRDKFHLTPLGVSPPPVADEELKDETRPPRIGYFARMTPAKGFDRAVDAWLALRRRSNAPKAQFWAGGYLGESDRPFFNQQRDRIKAAGLEDDFRYIGSPDERDEKFAFLKTLDVFSVPTAYREPKGIYVLEALACGVPVVQPDHGAFSEMVPASGGGLLVPPGDAGALADAWLRLLDDSVLRKRLGQAGRRWMQETMTPRKTAEATLEVFRKFLPREASSASRTSEAGTPVKSGSKSTVYDEAPPPED
jgi:glycosyltransferase involved in cell wall biosynthesis